jgi:hypothetical protein
MTTLLVTLLAIVVILAFARLANAGVARQARRPGDEPPARRR